jgi:hypothetical protein
MGTYGQILLIRDVELVALRNMGSLIEFCITESDASIGTHGKLGTVHPVVQSPQIPVFLPPIWVILVAECGLCWNHTSWIHRTSLAMEISLR